MRRRSITFAVSLLSVAFVAGCGGGAGTEAKAVSVETLQLAADNTEAARSTQFRMTIEVASGSSHEATTMTGEASGDGKQGRVVVEAADGGTIEELIVEDALYLKLDGLPFGNEELPAGKQWLRIGFDDLSDQLGLDLDELRDQAQSSTPASGLQYLQGLSGDVTVVADDTVNGEHATRYRASLDYSLVAEKIAGLSDAAKRQIGKLGIVPADVWIDDHDRVVKMHYTISGRALGVGSSADTAEVTMEITAFDVPIDVQAPPADEVVDLSDLPGALGAPTGTIPA